MRAFTSQKGPGKGLPASGFAPERRESPEFPRAPRSSRPSKLALSPAIDPDIEAYAQWLEDKITREAENVGFLEGRGHSPYKS